MRCWRRCWPINWGRSRPCGVGGSYPGSNSAQNVNKGISRVASRRRLGPRHQRMGRRPTAYMTAVRAALAAAIACPPPGFGIAASPRSVTDLLTFPAVEPVGVHAAVVQQVDLRATRPNPIAVCVGKKRQLDRIFIEIFDIEYEHRALPFALRCKTLSFLSLPPLPFERLCFSSGTVGSAILIR